MENVAGINAKPLVFHWFYCYLAILVPSGSENPMDPVGIIAGIDDSRIDFNLISEKVEWNRSGTLYFWVGNVTRTVAGGSREHGDL